jgi:hypothetical protein
LKKRTKKLLGIWTEVVKPTLAQMNKSFLLLFFKKEVLAFVLGRGREWWVAEGRNTPYGGR